MNFHTPHWARRSSRLVCAACAAILAASIVSTAVSSGDASDADEVNVFRCSFGDDWDVNYDRWPDRWIRDTSPDYPHYVNIEIHDDETATAKRSLRIALDGASAAVASPPIRVMSRFSYMLEADLKNEGLKYSTVFMTLDFCDTAGRVLHSTKSEAYSNTKGWAAVRLGPVQPSDGNVDRVVLGLRTVRAAKGDLEGHVSLANVRLTRMPRIHVSTNNPCNIYTQLDDVVVRCELSGIRERTPEIRFQLFDAFNQELESHRSPLDGKLIVSNSHGTPDIADGGAGPDGYEGNLEWKPKIPDYGYYRVVVSTVGSKGDRASNDTPPRTIDLVVVPPLTMPRHGEFGWTLADGDHPLSFQELSRLLPQVGINWVKVPVWFDAADPRRGDELIRFVELLGASNIDVVGIIDRPPSTTELSGRLGHEPTAAEVLSQDTPTWLPSLEPVMTRLSLRVRWWQLGRDEDFSFAALPEVNKRITDLRTAMFRFGQDVRIGMCCDWAAAEAHAGKVPWEFQQLDLAVDPTTKEFTQLLAKPRENSAQRWVVVEPPAPADSSAPTSIEARDARAADFVLRLVAAKEGGADAIIVSRPFNDLRGLMRANGMPAEMLLPWRTTACMLGGAQFMGRMQLPGGSENRLFLRPDGQVVMVVWNGTPTSEILYLGNDVRCVDLFGRTVKAPIEKGEQVIHTGRTPMFVLGLNEAITRLRMSVVFESNYVPSIFSKPHHNGLRFQNFFPQGVGGSVKIVVLEQQRGDLHSGEPEATPAVPVFQLQTWSIEPPQTTFQLAPNEQMKFPFDIKLNNALFGDQKVRIEFKIEADEIYQFSVYRQMEVGTQDLTLDVRASLDDDGTLIVEQLMTNSSPRLADFKCYLRAKGHRPQRMQVYRLGPNVDRRVYHYPDGRALIGKDMLLELDEINGPRILLHRFIVTDVSRDDKPASGSGDKPANAPPAQETAKRPPLARVGS
jgi:hypothetical protein